MGLSSSQKEDCIAWAARLGSICAWFTLWWLLPGFAKLRLGLRWYVPLGLFAAMESAGVMLERPQSQDSNGQLETEAKVIACVEGNVEKVVTAIAILAAIPAFLLGRQDIPMPVEFFSLLFVAAVAVLGGTISWFGAITPGSPQTLALLVRHVKAESYRHSLVWTLAAVVALYDWIAVNI